MDEAFSDLNSLMDKAKELVQLAEKYSEKFKDSNASDEEQEQFSNMLVTMGLGSIVTKYEPCVFTFIF